MYFVPKAGGDASQVSVEGQTFNPDSDGVIEVPDEFEKKMLEAGFMRTAPPKVASTEEIPQEAKIPSPGSHRFEVIEDSSGEVDVKVEPMAPIKKD